LGCCLQNFNRKQWNETRGRTRHDWEDDIKKVLKEAICDVVDWIYIGKDRIWWRAHVTKDMKHRII